MQRYQEKCAEEDYYDCLLADTVELDIYIDCLADLNQFYFDNNWISNVAELKGVSLFGYKDIDIRKIYAVYGDFMAVKKSLEVDYRYSKRKQDICDSAFRAMISLVDERSFIKEEKASKVISSKIRLKDDIITLMNDLKQICNC